MNVPLPWERLLWSRRTWSPRPSRDALTDLRLVHLEGSRSWEIALDDVERVEETRSRIDRLTGRSTVVVIPREPRSPVTLRHVANGPELAATIELLALSPSSRVDRDAVAAALAWSPAEEHPVRRRVAAAGVLAVLAVFSITSGIDGRVPVLTYGPDDPIAPNGVKRPREEIVAFMEREVMPWARVTLGPLKGGADRVTCATCHGVDAESQDWRMPAVAKLPEPHVRELVAHSTAISMDPQTRNAIFGYLAHADNQTKAGYMREVVLPEMARILQRSAYDFTRPYWHNRDRLAFGCYHCHKV